MHLFLVIILPKYLLLPPCLSLGKGTEGEKAAGPGSHSSEVLIPRPQHICQVTVRVRRNWPFQGLFLTFQSQLPG